MIAIIGGTFDPIHFGHLRPALDIAEQLALKEVRFIPSATPPHRWQPVASTEQRLAMVKLAVTDMPIFSVDDREYQREGASYTVDTLKSIRDEIGSDESLCMIIGFDAFQSFTQWRDWKGILKLTHLVVSSRPGYDQHEIEDWVKPYHCNNPKELNKKSSGLLYFANVTQLDISATFIREQISKGKSAQFLTSNTVNEYIIRNKLYEIE
ncbi:MAG: nicotinate-nucleotide adenylyltransferase [Cocleimonas sp.]